MTPETPAAIQTARGCAHFAPTGKHVLVRFERHWMAFTPEQLREVGDMLAHMLCCPLGDHYLEAGMRLRTPSGDHHLPLDRERAAELRDLANDALLLLEAERIASAA